MIIGGNITSLALFARVALLPVLLTFVIAVVLGWALAWLTGLVAADRRAVAIEVAFQNVALAIGIGIAFFPALAGIAAVSILWVLSTWPWGLGLRSRGIASHLDNGYIFRFATLNPTAVRISALNAASSIASSL